MLTEVSGEEFPDRVPWACPTAGLRSAAEQQGVGETQNRADYGPGVTAMRPGLSGPCDRAGTARSSACGMGQAIEGRGDDAPVPMKVEA